MTITRLLAQMTVTDLIAAEAWYTRLFDRGPDTRPMPGLLEWHLTDSAGVQVWAEAARAGDSTIVLDQSDLEEATRRLDAAGIAHPPAQDATFARIVPFQDPDGNRIVFTGPLGEA